MEREEDSNCSPWLVRTNLPDIYQSCIVDLLLLLAGRERASAAKRSRESTAAHQPITERYRRTARFVGGWRGQSQTTLQIALPHRIDRRTKTKSTGAAYIAFLFFAMCAGFDFGLRALTFLPQKELVGDGLVSRTVL